MKKLIIILTITLLLVNHLFLVSAVLQEDYRLETFYTFTSGGTFQNDSVYKSELAMNQLVANETNTSAYKDQEGIYYVAQTYYLSPLWKIIVILGLGTSFFYAFWVVKDFKGKHWPVKLALFCEMFFLLILSLAVVSTSVSHNMEVLINTVYAAVIWLFVFIFSYIGIVLLVNLFGLFNDSKKV